MTLLDRFLGGDRTALARLISYVENRTEGHQELLAKVCAHRSAGEAYRIGFTGPPGAGKSSLVNRVVVRLSDAGFSVGVIAVDPTSPFTGGAVLGDRIRMQELYGRSGVFVRSMATRGSSGGLAAATKDVCVLMEGFGFDFVLIETVGVGQIELDVAAVCDSVVVVFVPESGDTIQAMKSGLMEIADLFCINKSDRPGAERVRAELESILEVRCEVRRVAQLSNPPTTEIWNPTVTTTCALDGNGIDALWKEIEKHRAFLSGSDSGIRRRERVRADLVLSLSELFRLRMEADLLSSPALDEAVAAIVSGEADPYGAAQALFDRWSATNSGDSTAKRPS